MNDFEETLHSILSNPEEMERISRMAAQLMGGAADGDANTAPPSDGDEGALLRRLSGLLGGSEAQDKAALLRALSPWLHPERLARLRRALRIAGVLRAAGAALGEEGGHV